ncbi:MAG: hypothetical protein ACT4PL_04825 [Phycisphaerales bacterium]
MNKLCLIALAGIAVLGLAGCANSSKDEGAVAVHDEANCEKVKPGVVTTVNKYCAVVQRDPVDPVLIAEHKGQKVGFCCSHCVVTWKKMTDAEKDASLATAMKKN